MSRAINAKVALQGFRDGSALTDKAIKTGFEELDRVLDGGLYPGFYIVGAISSLGKTTFICQIMDQIARAGNEVILISMEMSAIEIISKSISRTTFVKTGANLDNPGVRNAKTARGITAGERYKDYSQREKALIAESIDDYETYAGLITIVEGDRELGVDKVRDIVEKFIEQKGKKPVLFLDYLQILAPSDPKATDKINVDIATSELRRISRDFKIPVVCVSSLNRNGYDEPVKMESFKESGSIEYSSDVLIGLEFEGVRNKDANKKKNKIDVNSEKSKNKREIEVVILKQRNAKTGTFAYFTYYPAFNCFSERATFGFDDEI